MPGLLVDQPPPAPFVTGPATKHATRPTNSLPQWLIDEARKTQPTAFDGNKHINFKPPANVVKMKDIGLEGHGISPNAVSEPFQLFSGEAIEQIRAEMVRDEVLEDCQFSSTFNKNMVRGMGPRRAPFTYDAWYSDELVDAVSKVAGIELIPAFDYEVANINFAFNNQAATMTNNDKAEPLSDDISTVAWHYDSFPFVCVVMLSDCEDMVGGETALKTPSGEIMKVRGPGKGTVVVMQGRYIEHQALKAMGGRERITMVTPFRPKSPHVRDETVLVGVRGISHKSELYTQYTKYRLENLQERIALKLKNESIREKYHKKFDTNGTRAWLMEQRNFLQSMIEEIHAEEEE